MKLKNLIVYATMLILVLCTVSCLPGAMNPFSPYGGELKVNFYGYPSEVYGEVEVTIDRIDVHGRGDEWKTIVDDECVIDIVTDEELSDEPTKAFIYKLSEGILEKGDLTEIRFRVTEVTVTRLGEESEEVYVKIPDEYGEGYEFLLEGNLVIDSFTKDYRINVTFYPDESVVFLDNGGLEFRPEININF